MKTETLSITKEAAQAAYTNATEKQKTMLENLFGKKNLLKDIMQRITCFDDILKELEGDAEVTIYNAMIAAGITGHQLYYQKIVLIAKALNEGWVPDWGNSSEYKYRPWFDMGGTSGSRFSYFDFDYDDSISCVGSRLCFKTRALAEFAGKTFINEYKDFMLML